MVDNSIALQVAAPPVSDLSTTLLKSYQIRNAQQQNELSGINLEAAKQRQGALADYSIRKQSGDPNAPQALAGQPDLMTKVFENMNAEREQKIRRIGDAAKTVYPLRGQPGFKEAWQREMDNLHKNGDIPDQTYKQWRDNPSELALNQALSMSLGLDAYLKAEGQATAGKIVSAIQPLLTPGTGEGGIQKSLSDAPQIDPYAANVISKESGGRNIMNAAGASSAGGVMQFTKGTWNDVIAKNPDLGLTPEDRMNPQKQIVAEPRMRRDNAISLVDAGVVPTDRNLYIAHFLGGAGASKFLTGMAENPTRPAIELVSPEAVAANRSVFYSPGGQPLTAQQVYENQTSRFGNGMAGISGIAPQRAAAIAPTATVNDRIAAAVPQLIGLAMTPGIPEDTRKTLLELGKAGITAGQPTTSEKDWQSYARAEIQAGRVPLDRLAWNVAQKKAGATQITVDAAGGKKVAEGLAERYLKAEDTARLAAGQIREYETLDKLLSDPSVYTGTGGETVASLKKLGTTLLGLDLKGVPNAEVAGKITEKLALSFRQKGEGSTSNFERALYKRMSVGLNDSAAGRTLMVQLAVSDARYLEQQAEIWRAHLRGDGSVDPTIYKALAEHDASRRKELSEFLDKANEVAGSTIQPTPVAGAENVVPQMSQKIQELRQKYKELEP